MDCSLVLLQHLYCYKLYVHAMKLHELLCVFVCVSTPEHIFGHSTKTMCCYIFTVYTV